MRYTIGIAVFGLALGASDARAQQPLTAGQRVRITSAPHRLTRQAGQVIAAGESTLTVEVLIPRSVEYRLTMVTDTVVLARDAIERVEVSRAHGRRTGRGAMIGLASGALLGGILGAASYEECIPEPGNFGLDCLWASESAGQEAMLGAVMLGLIGAGIGALVGHASEWDEWEEVPRGTTAVSLRPLPAGGVGLGVALRFD